MLGRLLVLLGLSLAVVLRGEEALRAGDGPALTSATSAIDLLTHGAQTMLVALAMWTLLATAAGALRRVPGIVGQAAHLGWRLLVPAALRVAVSAAVGAVVGAQVIALPALALDDSPATATHTTSGARTLVPSVDRPFTTVPARPGPAAPVPARPAIDRPTPDRATVTVRPGDSLWAIAERSLNSPSSAEVAAEWPRWYRQNRATIGADPDVIVVGTVLAAPQSDGGRS